MQTDIAPLKSQLIRAAMGEDSLEWLSQLELYPVLDSTNRYLLARVKHGAKKGTVCLAEAQSAGRGRHGRLWLSPPSGNIYLSLLWCFSKNPQFLSGLSIAAGVGVLRALQDQGVTKIGLKWPNDVLWDDRKLGGILVELVPKEGGTGVVVGVGINVNMPIPYREQLVQSCTDLAEATQNRSVDRNYLAGRLIHHFLLIMHNFERWGLRDCLDDWRRWDACYQREVYLYEGSRVISGIACGINEEGSLLLQEKGRISCHFCGEVSLRRVK
ncbi:Biotin--acetyl-CoA-carboxylase ligase [Nitrosococcus oceani ATCC 19707]|uniref:Biotin--acetyl-CoA-carboxylase ligase n=2 Tax=Nitrosococcus oceani TaxID=1229 RepID=Q3JEM5_NITOC|nr:biotin--[acetyl-CoA-carboxylase] ligase [Nitrosococcus oceani]ABA56721.1 Biotin--acetyl-CoA-carboxylase ligase [Nitrosococcus oceani ATCC 19707]EDZ65518.1 biotin-(acetyl-CoA-carboxylase) ligase [Nitrosococcus oceani AFC27]KFI20857.1 biotin--acetyl-CoA-carboxylase ligase [Nitrosococcus oceani C-27]GEM21617.1 biotin--[acetyl-CoA-carboxylase] ligase [Nitrosococcus oceani]